MFLPSNKVQAMALVAQNERSSSPRLDAAVRLCSNRAPLQSCHAQQKYILIRIYVRQQKLHVSLTQHFSSQPPRPQFLFLHYLAHSLPLLHHSCAGPTIIDVFLFYFSGSVLSCWCGWWWWCVICQKNLVRLLDCVGALHSIGAKWRDRNTIKRIQQTHTHVHRIHITTLQTNHFSFTRV